KQKAHNLGMQYCSQCGVEISSDSTQCPNCGATAGLSHVAIRSRSESPSASSTTARICHQCRRAIPTGAEVCPHCVRPFQPERSQPQGSVIAGNRAATLALLSISIAVAGGILARAFWGSGAELPWPVWIMAGLLLMALEVHYTRDFTLFCFGTSALLVGLI